MDLKDKVVVVTGATGGIGRALCLALARQGCRLGLLSRSPEKLEKLAVELGASQATLSVQPVDVGDRAAVVAALAEVERELGPVDVLIHNAGVGLLTDARAPDLDGVEQMLRVNYLAGVYALDAVLPGMLARGRGQLVAICSLGAWRTLPWCAAYAASKRALATYFESLRPPLRRRGVQVTTVFPGFVRTAMSEAIPLRWSIWMLRPEAAAARIVRAMVQERRELSFPWYEAVSMRLLRRLPAWLYDGLMAAVGRWCMRREY